MDFWQTLLTRRSIRRYTGEPVPAQVIDRVLTAAQWAPSAHGRQPWRWAVVTASVAKADLAQAMGARMRVDRMAEGDALDAVEAALARSYTRLTTAPALVVACSTLIGLDLAPGSRRWLAEHAMAMQSVAAAIQNLLLAAHAEGLGACWMCAPLFCPDVVGEVLALPADWEAQALITLGYPAETPKASLRRPEDEVVIYR